MPYTLPLGTVANFITGTIDFPRPYNGLAYRIGGAYAAPAGNNVQAQFPTTITGSWSRPAGNAVDFGNLPAANKTIGHGAVVIPIAVTGTGKHGVSGTSSVVIGVSASGAGTTSAPTKKSVRAGTVGIWAKANQTTVNLISPIPITGRENTERNARWGKPETLDTGTAAGWEVISKVDERTTTGWGAFDPLLSVEQFSRWTRAKAGDDQRKALWGAFGIALDEDRYSKWRSAKPADVQERGIWVRPRAQVYLPVPYAFPTLGAVNFSVLGGGVPVQLRTGGYVPPIGNAIDFVFGSTAYRAPYMRAPGAVDFYMPGSATNFMCRAAFVPAFDINGQPITESAQRDPYRRIVWGEPRPRDVDGTYPWLKFSRPLNPGWGIVVPGGPATPGAGQSVVVPLQRVYIVVNEYQLMRVSNMTPIVATGLNISFDCDSWLPQFSATIPESARSAVMPDPDLVEIEAVINGVQFRFFVERISRNRQFGQTSIAISGRGIACELDSPYAVASQHTNGASMTAQQLIAASLLNTTYTQSWGITDWLVPANTFSLHGTAAQVATAVAEASGSVLAADWRERDLRMLPRYPVKPWEWAGATPDYVIPSAVAQTESLEWIEKPGYNVVFVSGQENGVLGQVKITGTAGDLSAPMYTNQLITHLDAARQKGTSILSDTGKKSMMQISMPVLPATGIIDICKLVEFVDGGQTRRGIVRSNSISVNWPTVRQTLTIEASA